MAADASDSFGDDVADRGTTDANHEDEFVAALNFGRNEFLRVFPHESAIIFKRQLEVNMCVTCILVCHVAYLVYSHVASLEDSQYLLVALCGVRLLFFLPRPAMWTKMHEEYVNASAQPTPQLVRTKLMLAMDSRTQAELWFHIWYYMWLMLVPTWLFLRRLPTTSLFGHKLWLHCQANYLWIVASRFLQVVMFLCLKNSKLNRGISADALENYTEVVSFKAPWNGPGDSECAICFAEYTDGDGVRVLSCSHHFHSACIDKWLSQYLNHCPFCRNVVGPSDCKED